ncbi:MAG: hypothetical protein DRJ35_08295 [Thermoprotei archaeon]|nr:MAG: hypothetical protein DRJ35_08295 [Thermoprotei archaeon]
MAVNKNSSRNTDKRIDLPEEAFNKMISKAAWLLEEGRVVKISPYLYYVIGKRNRHMVRYVNGKFVCTCKGFKNKGICSHVMAVLALTEIKDADQFLAERINLRLQKELREIFQR